MSRSREEGHEKDIPYAVCTLSTSVLDVSTQLQAPTASHCLHLHIDWLDCNNASVALFLCSTHCLQTMHAADAGLQAQELALIYAA